MLNVTGKATIKATGLLLGLTMAMLAGGVAQARPADDSTKIGVGMICDSEAQAARFLELRASGRKADDAMAVVNREARNPKACGLAAIAFTQDAMLGSKPIDNQLVQVVRISIMAGYTGKSWQPMQGFVQYAILEGEGIEV